METLTGVSDAHGDVEDSQGLAGLQRRCKILQTQLDSERNTFHTLIHDLSHDVRSCLNGLLGFAQLLREDYKSEYAEIVIEGLYRIVRLVGRTMTTFDAGYQLGSLVEVDLNRLIPSVGSTMIPPSVVFSCRPLPMVIADPVSLEQAVQNLLANAIEHGKAERIDVRVESVDGGVCLLLRNDGEPVPEDIRQDLFRKRVSSKEDGGLGLGIVQRIMTGHGWAISLDPGFPTTFRVFIPAASIITSTGK